jgi:hypothetical protein
MKLITFFVMMATLAFCQRRFDPKNPDEHKHLPNSMGLSERLAASDYVVTGTIGTVGTVPTRLYQSQLENMEKQFKETGKMPYDRPALLYVVHVDSALCLKSDFQPESARLTKPATGDMYLVVNPSELGTRDDSPYREEILREGVQYLFSLGADPEITERLAKYDLDPKLPYFRVLHHSDGAIQLPTAEQRGKAGAFKPFGYQSDRDLATPVLNIATALCQAVQPTNALQKADGLERLKSSPDPVMRENADIALKILRGEPLR